MAAKPKKGQGKRDYKAIIDGAWVCEGPLSYVCECLGIEEGGAHRWMSDKHHREWGSIEPLPYLWEINGELYDAEQACKVLKCKRGALSVRANRGYSVRRYRVEPKSIDKEVIAIMIRDASKWHRTRV